MAKRAMTYRRKYKEIFNVSFFYEKKDGEIGYGIKGFVIESITRKNLKVDINKATNFILEDGYENVVILNVF